MTFIIDKIKWIMMVARADLHIIYAASRPSGVARAFGEPSKVRSPR